MLYSCCCCYSVTKLSLTLCDPMDCSTPDSSVLHYLPQIAQIHVHSISHLILRCPLLLSSIFPSIRVFSNESTPRIRWSKYWSFSFSISPSNVYSELISFRMTILFSLLSKGLSRVFSSTTVQKHPILQHSGFFMVQLSYL